MTGPIDEYRADLRQQLTGVPGADDVVAELDDHLRESSEVLSRHGMDAERAGAAAIGRLGDARTVARSIRADRGWLHGHDLVTVARRPFLIAEVLLILAALAYAVAVLLHELPCATVDTGQLDTTDDGTPLGRCFSRWEDWDLAPFLPPIPARLDGLSIAPATQLLFLVAATLMAAAVVQFSLRQPWLGSTRGWALLSGALTLTTGLMVAVEPLGLDLGLGWSLTAALGVDAAVLSAIALLWTSGLEPARIADSERAPKRGVVMTYTRYRLRASLILLASAGCGIHVLQQIALAPVAILVSASNRHFGYTWWAWTPWAGQLHTVLILAPAVASVILGRRNPHPAPPLTPAPDQDAARLA